MNHEKINKQPLRVFGVPSGVRCSPVVGILFMPQSYICPVCGFPNLTEPPHYADGGASDEICPSCGFQFGYDDDDQGITFEEWRRSWIERGMPWTSRGIARPVDWDAKAQLRNIL